MTNDFRTPDDIERDIDHERARMSDTFADLQDKFSVSSLVDEVSGLFGQTGAIGRSVSQTLSTTVARNPAAVALIGMGVAWLFLGKDRTAPADRHAASTAWDQRSHRRSANARWVGQDKSRHTGQQGDLTGGYGSSWFDDGPAYAPEGRGVYASGAQASEYFDRATHDVAEAASGVVDRVREGATAGGEAMSGAAARLGQSATDLTARLSQGLDDLSEDARSRVLAARRAAHDARLSSQEAMRKGARSASVMYEDQPLIAGALAVAVGAAIGAALPHSRVEDRTMGDSSDRLFAEAQSVYRAERDAAMTAARSAGASVKSGLGDLEADLEAKLPEAKDMADGIVDHAADAAGRVFGNGTSGMDGHKSKL
jgi:hypothetical protein